jgi:hypothetical protein
MGEMLPSTFEVPQPLHPCGSLARGCDDPARRLATGRVVMQLALSWSHSNLGLPAAVRCHAGVLAVVGLSGALAAFATQGEM